MNGIAVPFGEEQGKAAQGPPVLPEAVCGLPVLASSAYLKNCRSVSIRVPSGSPALPFDGTDTLASERYRIIRTKLVQHATSPRVVCISSSGSGDGKTVSSLNIAGSLGIKRETTAVLVDADLRCSQVAALLGLSNSPGLADVLSENCKIEEALIRIEQVPNLYVLPGGVLSRNSTELLDSSRWPALINSLRKEFDFVVLDSPPMGIVADYDLIHPVADGIVLVARPNHSDRKLLYKAIEKVPKEKLIGIILNCVEDWFLWRTNDSSYYRYISNSAPTQHKLLR